MEKFLNRVTSRIGPRAAVDLSRDAVSNALIEILITRGIVSQAEIDATVNRCCQKIARTIDNIKQ